MAEQEDAFVESEVTYKPRPPKSIKLPLNEDGSIDWESTSAKHIDAFTDAVKKDPNGILQNIKEEAEKKEGEPEEDYGIADSTVLTAANIIMMCEALGICSVGPKYVPVLKNLHPIVAAKACTITMEEMKPVLPESKRIIHRYLPDDLLSQEWQDIFVVGNHLAQLSVVKFKACVQLALEIDRLRNGQTANGPNGQVIDAEVTEVQ